MTHRMVPTISTPADLSSAVHAFFDAWPLVTTEPRTAESVAIAVAHCALECGNFGIDAHGRSSNPPTLYNNNVGNTRPASNEDCDVCQYPCSEIIKGHVVRYRPPQPESTFRSFPTLIEGVRKQLEFLAHWDPAHDPHYAAAWRACLAGNVAAFVHELRAGGYFTANEEIYLRGVTSIYERILPIVKSVFEIDVPVITDADREHVAQMVAMTLDGVRSS